MLASKATDDDLIDLEIITQKSNVLLFFSSAICILKNNCIDLALAIFKGFLLYTRFIEEQKC